MIVLPGIYLGTVFFYGVGGVLYWIHFVRRAPKVAKWATSGLVIGLVLHAGTLIVYTLRSGHLPLATLPDSVSLFAWLFALAYMYLEVRLADRSLGPFVLTMVTLATLIGLVAMPERRPLPDMLRSGVLSAHVSVSLLGYAFFALSFVGSLSYILLAHEIQARRLAFFYERVPSLERLDRLSHQAVVAGFLCLTVGIGIGGVWALRVWGALSDAKYVATLAVWAVYGVYLYTYSRRGWRGRRAAYLSALGFGCLLTAYTVFNLLFTRLHAW